MVCLLEIASPHKAVYRLVVHRRGGVYVQPLCRLPRIYDGLVLALCLAAHLSQEGLGSVLYGVLHAHACLLTLRTSYATKTMTESP